MRIILQYQSESGVGTMTNQRFMQTKVMGKQKPGALMRGTIWGKEKKKLGQNRVLVAENRVAKNKTINSQEKTRRLTL